MLEDYFDSSKKNYVRKIKTTQKNFKTSSRFLLGYFKMFGESFKKKEKKIEFCILAEPHLKFLPPPLLG